MNPEFLEAVRPAAERVGWTLVHSTWEGAAVAAALWVTPAIMGRASARRRYAAGCLALAAVVVAMGVTFARVEATRRAPAVVATPVMPAAAELRVADAAPPVQADVPAAKAGRTPVAAAGSWDVRARIAPWLPGVVGAWAAGVAGLALWHVGGWAKVRRMTRAASAAPWQDRAREIAARMGVSRGVRVVESALAGVPAVVGFVRPVILLPIGLAAEMSVAQVEAILAHELAHVRRNDYLVNLIQTAVETLLFYHPAVWWISGQVRQEREHCCDDLAVAACRGDRAGYARALARVEEIRGARLPLAAAADGGSLLGRVRRLAGKDAPHVAHPSPLMAVVMAVVCAAGLVVLAGWPARAAGPKPEPTVRPAATRPASTRPAAGAGEQWNGMRVSPVRPEDLVPTAGEYRIAANDLVTVTVGESVLSRRVTKAGKISLPQAGEVAAAGKTEAELGRSLTGALGGKAASGDAQVSVRVVEARGNTFSTWGPGVDHPGQYPIIRPDLRLSDAFAMAGVSGKRAVVRVLRHEEGGDQRVVAVPAAAVLAGDPKANLVIRRGDALFVEDPDRRFLRVVVGRETLTLDGKPTDLAGVEEALRAIPAEQRARADVSVLAESDDVPVGRLMWVVNTCDFEARRLGMPGAQNRGVQSGIKRVASTRPAATRPAAAGLFYVGGRVHQPGVYGIGPGGTTLAGALAAAGVPAEGPAFVTVVRQSGDRQTFVVDGVPARDVAAGGAGDVAIRSGDRVAVTGATPPAAGRATVVFPAPRAGAIGEIYVGGHVRQPGVYSVSGRKVTLAGAVTMALGPDNDAADLTEVRRRDPGHETVTRVSIRKVLDGTEPDLYLQPNDEVNVGVPAPADAAGK